MIAIIIIVGFILLFVELMFFKLLDIERTLKETNNRLKDICIILENERGGTVNMMTNCPNCGHPFENGKCKYCGTEKPIRMKSMMKISKDGIELVCYSEDGEGEQDASI